jgi:hypothetical protein
MVIWEKVIELQLHSGRWLQNFRFGSDPVPLSTSAATSNRLRCSEESGKATSKFRRSRAHDARHQTKCILHWSVPHNFKLRKLILRSHASVTEFGTESIQTELKPDNQ